MTKTAYVFALLAILIGVGTATAEDIKVNMRLLVIASKADAEAVPQLEVAKRVLHGFNIPYDVLYMTDKNGKALHPGPLNLVSTDGAGRYYGIVLTDNTLSYSDGVKQIGTMTKAQWTELKEYELRFQVRRVSLFTDPDTLGGVQAIEGAGSSDENSVVIDEAFAKTVDPAQVGGARAVLKWSWHLPAAMRPGGAPITPVAYFGNYAQGAARPLAGASMKTADGREQLHLFFFHSVDSMAGFGVGPVWVNWLTRGLYLGKRRVYLHVQIDDVFLPSAIRTVGVPGSQKIYRMNAYDLEAAANARTELLPLTLNPEFRIEMAFNGDGVMEAGGLENDALYLAARKRLVDFHWVSHTYTHENLNHAKYERVHWELLQNAGFAKGLMAGAEHLFSPRSLVTPQISGLFNAQALRAMKANGIQQVVNDNTHEKQQPPYQHIAYYSTQKVNGEAGILIMPRNAPDVYYETSLAEELAALYTLNRVGLDSGKHYTFAGLMDEEADKTLPHMLTYEASAYMFHQANLRVTDIAGAQDSLVSAWMKRVLKELRVHTTLPVLSMKMDAMADHYRALMDLEKCGRNGRVFMSPEGISKIQVWADGKCSVPVTVVGGGFKDVPVEQYGPDATASTGFTGAGTQSRMLNLSAPIKL